MDNARRYFQPAQHAQINGSFSNTVFVTTDHDIFKLSKRNRNVIITKEMMEQGKQGFITPIIVNENMVVIDGQHRLEVSRALNTPVEYIIKPGLDDDDIIRMNTVQKKWNLLNYIESFANEGREEYIKLVNLIKRNYSNVTVTAAISVGDSTSTGRASELIKTGRFSFFNYKKTVEFLEYYKRFREETKTPKRTTTATALYELFKVSKFDKNRMIEKTIQTELGEDIKVKTFKHTDILKNFIDSYNQNLKTTSPKYISYHITSTGALVIDEDLEFWANKKSAVATTDDENTI